MSVTVKHGDQYPVTFTANGDLTGSTVRLLARIRYTTGDPILLGSTVTDPAGGVVTHDLTGTLEAGTYDVELEVTRGGEVFTFPNGDGKNAYETLTVVDDLG